MAYEIRQFGDPVLRSRAAPVETFDDTLRRLADGMLATLRAGEGRAAIAANQVGVLMFDRADREARRAAMKQWRERLLARAGNGENR